MTNVSPRVAIAGAGDSARYLVLECIKQEIPVTVISRASRPWFEERRVPLCVSDYSHDSLVQILNETNSTILVSLLHDNDPSVMVPIQAEMLSACQASSTCKRFIPSEMGGDIHPSAFPEHPLFYVPTHIPIREALSQQSEIEWTLLCIGWFGDYWHLPTVETATWKSYMKDLRPVWPVDTTKRTIRINGDGNAPVTFTAAQDVAAAMVKLFKAPTWEPYTYIAGETTTWNSVSRRLADLYGTPFSIETRSLEDIDAVIAEEEKASKADSAHPPQKLWLAYMDKWNAIGAAGLPSDKVQAHRQKFFEGLSFMTIADIVRRGRELQETGPDDVL